MPNLFRKARGKGEALALCCLVERGDKTLGKSVEYLPHRADLSSLSSYSTFVKATRLESRLFFLHLVSNN